MLLALTTTGLGVPFFAQLATDRERIYEQEAFHLTLSIHATDPNLERQVTITDLPPADQLSLEPFRELPLQTVMREGVAYQVRRFQCRARAARAGRLRIAPALRGRIVHVTRSYFFIQQQERPVDIPAEPLELEILPLPPENRPPDFSGAVGAMRLEAAATPTNVAVGDLITVTTILEGDANCAQVVPPAVPEVPGLKVYAVQPARTGQTDTRRVFEQIVVPLASNVTAIPALTFAYFDPRTGVYRRLTAGPFALTFHPDKAPRPPDYLPALPTNLSTIAMPPAAPVLKPRPRYWRSTTLRDRGWRRIGLRDEMADKLFEQAAKAYAAGAYADTISLYAAILARGRTAPELDYNIAVASQQNGDCARAVLHYRRVWYERPRDPDVRARLIQAATAAQTLLPDRSPPGRWLLGLSQREWRVLAGLLAGAAVLTLLAAVAAGRHSGRLLPLSAALAIMLAVSLGGLWSWHTLHASPEAVVMGSNAILRLAPHETALPLTTLNPGTIVTVHEVWNDWARVSSVNGIGWLPSSSFTIVNPLL